LQFGLRQLLYTQFCKCEIKDPIESSVPSCGSASLSRRSVD
jgi:hypothetical protein